jgi:pyruvate/2-oxoglutarate dehydrogenase complex dihydrolipoamide acyltransferase (E2) component
MAQMIPMPRLGELTESAVITRWLCAVGDVIEEGQSIAEVETDKVETELVSPLAGRITRILVNDGDEVDVGTALLEVES